MVCHHDDRNGDAGDDTDKNNNSHDDNDSSNNKNNDNDKIACEYQTQTFTSNIRI